MPNPGMHELLSMVESNPFLIGSSRGIDHIDDWPGRSIEVTTNIS